MRVTVAEYSPDCQTPEAGIVLRAPIDIVTAMLENGARPCKGDVLHWEYPDKSDFELWVIREVWWEVGPDGIVECQLFLDTDLGKHSPK